MTIPSHAVQRAAEAVDRTAGPAPLLTPSCKVGQTRPDLHDWCGWPGTQSASGWIPIPCECECHTEGGSW